MKIFHCFDGLVRRKNKGSPKPLNSTNHRATPRIVQIGFEETVQPKEKEEPTNKDVSDTHDCGGSGSVDGDVGRTCTASPKLKRSCSSLEAREVPESPKSVVSQRSADRVQMLKKYSSKQILPSRSRRLWWTLFLRSHSRRVSSRPQPFSDSGYPSDTLERHNEADHSSNSWPHYQWLVISAESLTFKRVDEWVRNLDAENPIPAEENGELSGGYSFPETPPTRHVTKSLDKLSSATHLSNMGLKIIPAIYHFNNLKSVDLSNNFINQITPGSLPKSLHELNLSKNNICVVEGLRDLTRLRLLDLSYNHISRIGQGLSNNVLIKELNLAGNKIRHVEGLHRLVKLTVLDLGYNKITTAKAIDQLVANYCSLLAVSLLGNPIQTNMSPDQLRRAVCGLLPKLVYLNRQPVKPLRGTTEVARAALVSSYSKRQHRRTAKRDSGFGGSKNRPRPQLRNKTTLH